MRFALNVFIATAILWFLLRRVADTNPIWAIASMIAASDPQREGGGAHVPSRMINVLVGCAVGSSSSSSADRTSGSFPWPLR